MNRNGFWPGWDKILDDSSWTWNQDEDVGGPKVEVYQWFELIWLQTFQPGIFAVSPHRLTAFWIWCLWNTRVLLSCGFLLIPSAGSTSQFQARRLTDLTAVIISVLSGCSCNTTMSWRLMFLWSRPPAVCWRCSLSNLLQTTQARARHHSSFYSYKPHRNHPVPV